MGLESAPKKARSPWDRYEKELDLSAKIAAAEGRCQIAAAIKVVLRDIPLEQRTAQDSKLVRFANVILARKGEVTASDIVAIIGAELTGEDDFD